MTKGSSLLGKLIERHYPDLSDYSQPANLYSRRSRSINITGHLPKSRLSFYLTTGCKTDLYY